MRARAPLAVAFACLMLAGCSGSDTTGSSAGGGERIGRYKIGAPYKIAGKWYYPKESFELVETGIASWYGPGFHGRTTANGETFNENALTAAHPTLQMPSMIRVTNLDNGRSLALRVNDRGPFAHGRVLDVSKKAAEMLGFRKQGTAKVRIEVLSEESRQLAVLAQGSGSRITRPTVAVSSKGDVPLPSGKVTRQVVAPSNIFIQAGTFRSQDNANRFSARLGKLARTGVDAIELKGERFYRVRLGPIPSVDEADRLLVALVDEGVDDARVVVE